MKENNHLLKKALITLFELYDKGDKRDLQIFYYEELKKYDPHLISERIYHLIRTSKFFPKISEILAAVLPSETAEIERAWIEFVRTREFNYACKVMPDWVYTIKTYLGAERCERNLDGDVWIKKEFEKLYPLVKSGHIPLAHDPMAEALYCVPGTSIVMQIPYGNVDNRHKKLLSAAVKFTALKQLKKGGE